MSNDEQKQKSGHQWTFVRTGGVDQVCLRDGEDIAHIPELDQALWMALALPVKGTECDEVTAAFLDRNSDGRILPEDIIAAVEWSKKTFTDLNDLVRGGDAVRLDGIKDPDLQASARRVLSDLGKKDAAAITLADISSQERLFSATLFNGDGVIPADCSGDETIHRALQDVMSAVGSTPDRSGKPGINQALLDTFFTQAADYLAWIGKAATVPAGLDVEKTAAALGALRSVRAKVDDYFIRCRLAAFNPEAPRSPDLEETTRLLHSGSNLTLSSPEMEALPLAHAAPEQPLPLSAGINPAWASRIQALADLAVHPLLGAKRTEMSEADWQAVQEALRPFEGWQNAKPATSVESLGAERLKELTGGTLKQKIADLIQRDLATEKEYAQLIGLERMIRFQRDLFQVLCNYVNFAEFYQPEKTAIFQAGRLYLDARVCDLCIEVIDAAKHATLAVLSGACLAYCDLKRPGAAKTIVAIITDGDSDGLMVGRNGIFYDRRGACWDATITRLVANPISVREAFWMPYKKFVRLIEEQVAKRALAAEQASLDKVSTAASTVATADQQPAAPAAAASAMPKKFDLGTIALIGAAIGGISALVGGFLEALFGLGAWIPLGIAGVILLISGPSMLLAWLKLRKRNLGPILDANGWAINTCALINVPFGTSMTRLAALPPNARRSLNDSFAVRRTPWGQYLLLLAVLALLAFQLTRVSGRTVGSCLPCLLKTPPPAEQTKQP